MAEEVIINVEETIQDVSINLLDNSENIGISILETPQNVGINITPTEETILFNIEKTNENVNISISNNGEKGDPGTTDHALLTHLDYNSSGHTGFASSSSVDYLSTLINNKVDKELGKGLSSNDYTTTEKTKLASIEYGAEANINADWNATSGDAEILNKPNIPTKTSDLVNDLGFISEEVDPIFTSSPSYSITNSEIINWNTAYSNTHTHSNKTALDSVSGVNTGDETNSTIKAKLGAVSASNDGYLTTTQYNIFNNKQDALGYIPENIANKGLANGYVPLNASTKIDTAYIPDSIIGQVHYIGTWNANTNTPTLVSSVGSKGDYYIVNTSGSTTIDGISDWKVGDWIVFDGTIWDKIDNTDAISSFNGRTGAIILSSNDVTTALGYTPVTNSRTLAINGITYDLSTNRTWTVGDLFSTSSYSNPSWITSLTWSKIINTPTTLSGYGISSTDSLFDGKYQPLLPATPSNPTQMYLNGNLQWSLISVGNGGYAANLYNTVLASTIVSGYSQLSYIPDTTETQYSNTITNEEVLFRTYLYEQTLDITAIDAGLWSGAFTAKVSNAVGITQIKFEPFVRHSDGTETTLFSMYSPELDNLDFVTIRLQSSQSLFIVSTTDRLGIRVYGKTTSSAAITITTIIGDGRGGYFAAPIRLRHNQLRDLNQDSNYLHTTSSQQTNWNNAYNFTSNFATNYPDLSAIEVLTGTSGLLKKTAANTWTLDTNTYLTGNQSITLSGEATGSGTTSIPVTLTNSSVIGKVLTGYTATSGTISASDSILQSIQKLGYDKHVAVTLGTTNGLSLSTQTLSLALANTTTTGALSSTDWNTFNGKQSALSGTGIVKSTSGTISYLTDNSSNWDAAYTHSTTTTGSVHGSTTVGGNFFRLANPSAITFPRINADNTVSALSASDFRTAIGAGTSTVTPSALTKVDDTNVTLTLGGTPSTALLQGVSLTLGWNGTLADSRIASASTWNAKQNAYTNLTSIGSLTNANGFLRQNGSGVFSYDTNTYYLASNPSGYITSSALSGYATQSWVGSNYATINHSHNLERYSLAAPAHIDSLTTSNFRTTLFGQTTNGYYLSTARWNSTPTVGKMLNPYGTMLAWGGDDTHGFIATDYYVNNAVIGGGYGDIISWSETLLHSGNYNTYSPTLAGTGATGTWNINISGTAANATTWNAQVFNNSYHDTGLYSIIGYSTSGAYSWFTDASVKSWLGLGSAAYTNSNAYFGTYGTRANDLNVSNLQGSYYWNPDTTNRPNYNYGTILNIDAYGNGSGSGWNNQLAFSTDNTILFRQSINNNTNWTGWRSFVFADQLGSNAYSSIAYLPSSNISGTSDYIPKFTNSNTIGNSSATIDSIGVAIFPKLSGPAIAQLRLTTATDNYGSTWAIGQKINSKDFGIAYYETNWSELFTFTTTGSLIAPSIKLTTGAGVNKVLTSDASGNATWQTPTTLISGTYTPTLTNISGTSSLSSTVSVYTRIGNNVHVGINGQITSTTGACVFTVSLPINTSNTNSILTGSAYGGQSCVALYGGSISSNVITVSFYGVNASQNFSLMFDYIVS